MADEQTLSNPTLMGLEHTTPERDWTLSGLLDIYPWVDGFGKDDILKQLNEATISGAQFRSILGAAATVNDRYGRMAETMEKERQAAILDAILEQAELYNPGPPDGKEYFMADADSLAAGVTLQHWQVAMREWIDCNPGPDDRGVASCNMYPDGDETMSFAIDMRCYVRSLDESYQCVELHAFSMDNGKGVGSAVWMIPNPPAP